MSRKRTINFGAGPSKLPLPVLEKIQQQLLDFDGTGCSVMELSHRSATFDKILNECQQDLRDILSIPSNYHVIFLQGGGTAQFSAIPLNLCGDIPVNKPKFDYMVTGSWSKKAADEAKKYGEVNLVFQPTKTFTSIPDKSEWNLSPDARYVYYCDNETIHGIEHKSVPDVGDKLLVCDMSSNFLTRRIDVSKYGVIFAGAQKNVGIAGLTIVIVRNDLISNPSPFCPSILEYKTMVANNSCYNTPPCFAIYVTGLYLKYIKENGGIDTMFLKSIEKSSIIYGLISESNGFYQLPIDEKCRSRTNVPFRIGDKDEKLEAEFIKESIKARMIQLKGHRSVGGIRASLYNAVTVEDTRYLAAFMDKFRAENN